MIMWKKSTTKLYSSCLNIQTQGEKETIPLQIGSGYLEPDRTMKYLLGSRLRLILEILLSNL